MLKSYNPKDWYWYADDGRLFSSAQVAVIANTDTDYTTWRAAGNYPTRWPADESGAQTVEALQDVLTPYGQFADLRAYARDKFNKKLSRGVDVSIGSGSERKTVHASTDALSLALLNTAVAVASKNPNATTPWVPKNGMPTTLNAQHVAAISQAVHEFVQGNFGTLSNLITSIATGAVTTRAQVDAAFD